MTESYVFDCSKNVPKECIEHWKLHGFAILRGVFDVEKMKEVVEHSMKLFPDDMEPTLDFGGDTAHFPTCGPIDEITMDERLIGLAKECLGVNEIRLAQSIAWPKKGNKLQGEMLNNNQRMHCDYGNHTFLHPPPWNEPNLIAAIVYLSDINETGGGTAVVPREGDNDELYEEPLTRMPGYGPYKFFNDQKSAEDYFADNFPDVAEFRQKLYNREIRPVPQLGDVLLYRHDIWHRGTPVNEDIVRRVLNLTWKKAGIDYIYCWDPGFATSNYSGKVEEMFKKLTPIQRNTLGIPLPGDSYWTDRTVSFLEARYPGIDVSPYKN